MQLAFFREDSDSLLMLLDQNGVSYVRRQPTIGVPMAAGITVEVLIDASEIALAVAWALTAYLKNRRSRKIIVTLKDETIVHAEGYSSKELAEILPIAKHIAVFDPEHRKKPQK